MTAKNVMLRLLRHSNTFAARLEHLLMLAICKRSQNSGEENRFFQQLRFFLSFRMWIIVQDVAERDWKC